MENHTVVVLGASDDPLRYSNRALKILIDRGYNVIPVHPVKKEIEGLEVSKSLKDIDVKVDTLTLYVSIATLEKMSEEIIRLNPERVIFNPGTESQDLISKLKSNNIKTIQACSIVMLNTNQF